MDILHADGLLSRVEEVEVESWVTGNEEDLDRLTYTSQPGWEDSEGLGAVGEAGIVGDAFW